MEDQHDQQLNDMTSKFKKIDENYRLDAIETRKQIHMTELEREDNDRLITLFRTQNEVLDTQNRQYSFKIDDLEANLLEKDHIVRDLRDENLNLAQSRADHAVGDISIKEYMADLKLQLEGKTFNYDSLAAEMAETKEKLVDSTTQHTLAKEQLKLVEQAFTQVREAKSDDERRWLREEDSNRKRMAELDQRSQRSDEQLEELRFANRSLAAEVSELKKDSACMGQMLDDETNKVDKVTDRERVVHQAELDIKSQK